ncbi:EamA family transporter [Phenylobacterium sp.]|uniref:EamA family transporter n=1 Tax=Phenylobacterium sp. TaxID=1871053 RepID=UPI0027358DAC|nr:EamA family transporter [Phenylobacterium sp.]MDP3660626.1 EamA family transporter [Phenylobacterium sp.]
MTAAAPDAPTNGLSGLHFLLALAVVAVWGTNFVVIHVGLEHLPPLMFAALRFILATLPWIFILKRPPAPWRDLASYGVLVGFGQFGLMYVAMRSDISPGLASLVIQTQVFLTVGLAAVLAREKVRGFQFAALAFALAGLVLIAMFGGQSATPKGLVLVLLAALSWAASNIVVKRAGQVNMLAYVVWGSLFSAPPLIACSFALEGWPAIAAGFRDADLVTWLAVIWQAVGNTLFGYAAWGWLLGRYPAASVTPMALLVPVFGMGSSALLLGEPLQSWKLIAAALVVAGLAINMLWPLWTARRARARLA